MRDRSRPITILLVDDEAGILSLFSLVLRSKGYEVITAANGFEALELCRRNKPKVNLLLTDVDLPKKNGLELARELRTLQPDLSVLLMSGNPSRCQDDNNTIPFAFLEKPFLPKALLQEVERELSKASL